MTSDTSTLRRLRAGEDDAARALWLRYFDRLAGLARRILGDAPRQTADEEDVALSALDSFCRGLGRGRYPLLHDRDSLWRLLVVITRRKALDLVKTQGRLRHGGGVCHDGRAALEEMPATEPTPEFVALMADQCRHLMTALDDPELRVIAQEKMEGYTNEEIAASHRCSLARIERKLRLIRDVWKHQP